MLKIYYEKDADVNILKGKKIAVIGYGSQGHAQAQNLKESGMDVIVSTRAGTPNYQLATKHGFKPVSVDEAAQKGDFIQILMPDETQRAVYEAQIKPHLKEGKTLCFSHGFNIHFGQIVPPNNIDVIMVAPKGPGHLVRSEFEKGGGVPCLMAIHQDATGKAREKAMAYAHGIGGTRAGVMETTFAEETETDLFGEQAVLCGGAAALVKAGFETLVEAGYQPELAYFECMHELKLIVDLFLSGRSQLYAVFDQQYRRIRRPDPRSAHCNGRNKKGNEADIVRNTERKICQRVDIRKPGRETCFQRFREKGQRTPHRKSRQGTEKDDEMD